MYKVSYSDAVNLIDESTAKMESITNVVNNSDLTPTDFYNNFESGETIEFIKAQDGSIKGIRGNFTNTASDVSTVENTINSNAGLKSKVNSKATVPVNSTITAGGKVNLSTELAHIGGASITDGAFSLNTIGVAAAAVGTGILLGKAFDSTLYNLNPDFWDEHNMSTLNPETWNSITSDISVDDPWYVRAGGVGVNAMLGIGVDSPTAPNTAQMYLDEETIAYMAAYLQNMNALIGGSQIVEPVSGITLPEGVSLPFNITEMQEGVEYTQRAYSSTTYIYKIRNNTAPVRGSLFAYGRSTSPEYASTQPFEYWDNFHNEWRDAERSNYGGYVTYRGIGTNASTDFIQSNLAVTTVDHILGVGDFSYPVCTILAHGAKVTTGVQGITNQPGATVPDLSGITEIADVLTALKAQLPELFTDAKAVVQTIVDENGLQTQKVYYPVPMPQIDPNAKTRPITNTELGTQTQTKVDPEVAPDSLLQLITSTILGYPTTTPNPPDTGDGTTPAVVTPTGTAGALFAVYNPTQSQINDFGAWLWSTNFVDQLLKMFNDPMQAIISLHKVFAAPTTGGSQNIYVGYLDSGVSSATVSAQYTDVDCGSVNVSEVFGNVFDYTQTKISIYLPFIGIVPLNVSDVMRSTIHVIYHVDVLTGACLADVDITRDLGGGVLYQYSGDCAVHYPLSSGSYMGIVSSIISVAGGVAGSIMSGGALTPVLMGAAAGAMNAHTDVARTGGLSGNAGAMGSKIPYLIISRPQSAMSTAYASVEGVGSNNYVTLSTCTGFVRIKEVQLSGVPALDNELTEIYTQLREGVIV